MGDDIGWMQPSYYHRGLMVGETLNIDRIAAEGGMFMTYYAESSCTFDGTAKNQRGTEESPLTLERIVNRMQELQFPKDDPLYDAVWNANSGNTSLSILIIQLAGEAKWRETGPAVKEWDSKRKRRGGR